MASRTYSRQDLIQNKNVGSSDKPVKQVF